MREICGDGIDQDCDGEDELCDDRDADADGFSVGDGDCDDSNPLVNPRQTELCDDIDNDCDDIIDENIRVMPETCDGLDNDCDGTIDEGDREVVVGCVDEEEANPCLGGPVTRSLVRPCGTNIGECNRGHEVCGNGRWSECRGAQGSMEEVCDGRDNDCDGQSDENVMNDEQMVPGERENICRPDCADCPVVWAPVCGRDNRVYASECHAHCITGQEAQPLARCLRLREQALACEVDADCVRLAPRNGLCVPQGTVVEEVPALDPVSQCIAQNSTCGCINNRCDLEPRQNANRCGAGVGME